MLTSWALSGPFVSRGIIIYIYIYDLEEDPPTWRIMKPNLPVPRHGHLCKKGGREGLRIFLFLRDSVETSPIKSF